MFLNTKLDSGHPYYAQLAAVIKSYLLTSVTWLYRGLKCYLIEVTCSLRYPLTIHRFLIDRELSSKISHCLRNSVFFVSFSSWRFDEHDLEWPLSRGCWKLFPLFFIVFILRIALNRPHNKSLINLVLSVITGKSQTSALMYWPR